MKKLIILVATYLIASSCSFADVQSANNPYTNKYTPSLKELTLSWKNQQYMHAKQDKNDIAIVYGGADISRKPALRLHSAIV